MNKSEQINELATALAKAQAVIKAAPKDHDNPFFKSKYADLASVWDACRGPLTENGIAIVQGASGDEKSVTVTTMLLHSSGQWIEESLRLNPTKNDPQGAGSAITYARRYGLAAIVGVVADEDDDGNAASKPQTKPEGKPAAKAKPEPKAAPELTPEQSDFNAWVKPLIGTNGLTADAVRDVVKNHGYAVARTEIEKLMTEGAKA